MNNVDVRIKVTSHTKNASVKAVQSTSANKQVTKQQQISPLFPAIKSSQDSTNYSKSPYKGKDKEYFNFNQSINSSNSKTTLSQSKVYSNIDKDDELIKIKEHNLKLTAEKKYLANEIQRMQKELDAKDKLFKDITNQSTGEGGQTRGSPDLSRSIEKSKESVLIGNMKKQFKELQLSSKLKEEELDRLKKNIKVTKMSEMSEEVEVLKKELIKLKELSYDLASKKAALEKLIKEETDTTKNIKHKLLVEEDRQRKLLQEIAEKDNTIKELETRIGSFSNSSSVAYGIIDLANECQKYKELNDYKDSEIQNLKNDFNKLLADLEMLEKKRKSLRAVNENIFSLEIQDNQSLGNKQEQLEEPKSADDQPKLIFDESKAEIYDADKLEEVSYLIQKMLQARDIDIVSTEEFIFLDTQFDSPAFLTTVAENFANLICINHQSEVDIVISFIATCIDVFPKDLDHFKLKFSLMLESISFKNPKDIEKSLKDKLILKSTSILNELRGLNQINFFDFCCLIAKLEVSLTEKENNYLIYRMKQNMDEQRIYGLNTKFVIDLIDSNIHSEEADTNHLIYSYRQNVVDQTYVCTDEFYSFFFGYSSDMKVATSRSNQILEALKKHLNESLITLPEFLKSEMIQIKLADEQSFVSTFHINSLLKVLQKEGIMTSFAKKDVYNLFDNFKLDIQKLTNNKAVINSISEANVQIMSYLDLNLLESKLKIPLVSAEDKNFYCSLKDYLDKGELSFEAIEFLLQFNLSFINQEDIINQHLNANPHLIHFAHLEKIMIIPESEFMKFLASKDVNSRVPNHYIITKKSVQELDSDSEKIEVTSNERFVNLTGLKQRIATIKYIINTNSTPAQRISKTSETIKEVQSKKQHTIDNIDYELDQINATQPINLSIGNNNKSGLTANENDYYPDNNLDTIKIEENEHADVNNMKVTHQFELSLMTVTNTYQIQILMKGRSTPSYEITQQEELEIAVLRTELDSPNEICSQPNNEIDANENNENENQEISNHKEKVVNEKIVPDFTIEQTTEIHFSAEPKKFIEKTIERQEVLLIKDIYKCNMFVHDILCNNYTRYLKDKALIHSKSHDNQDEHLQNNALEDSLDYHPNNKSNANFHVESNHKEDHSDHNKELISEREEIQNKSQRILEIDAINETENSHDLRVMSVKSPEYANKEILEEAKEEENNVDVNANNRSSLRNNSKKIEECPALFSKQISSIKGDANNDKKKEIDHDCDANIAMETDNKEFGEDQSNLHKQKSPINEEVENEVSDHINLEKRLEGEKDLATEAICEQESIAQLKDQVLNAELNACIEERSEKEISKKESLKSEPRNLHSNRPKHSNVPLHSEKAEVHPNEVETGNNAENPVEIENLSSHSVHHENKTFIDEGANNIKHECSNSQKNSQRSLAHENNALKAQEEKEANCWNEEPVNCNNEILINSSRSNPNRDGDVAKKEEEANNFDGENNNFEIPNSNLPNDERRISNNSKISTEMKDGNKDQHNTSNQYKNSVSRENLQEQEQREFFANQSIKEISAKNSAKHSIKEEEHHSNQISAKHSMKEEEISKQVSAKHSIKDEEQHTKQVSAKSSIKEEGHQPMKVSAKNSLKDDEVPNQVSAKHSIKEEEHHSKQVSAKNSIKEVFTEEEAHQPKQISNKSLIKDQIIEDHEPKQVSAKHSIKDEEHNSEQISAKNSIKDEEVPKQISAKHSIKDEEHHSKQISAKNSIKEEEHQSKQVSAKNSLKDDEVPNQVSAKNSIKDEEHHSKQVSATSSIKEDEHQPMKVSAKNSIKDEETHNQITDNNSHEDQLKQASSKHSIKEDTVSNKEEEPQNLINKEMQGETKTSNKSIKYVLSGRSKNESKDNLKANNISSSEEIKLVKEIPEESQPASIEKKESKLSMTSSQNSSRLRNKSKDFTSSVLNSASNKKNYN